MLVELLIAMTFLAIAVGALMAIYGSTAVSLRHTSVQGNAHTLVDKQMETFKTLPYSGLAINTSTIPTSDPYVTNPPSNLTTGQQVTITSGQIGGGTVAATQTVTGPDNGSYRIDTYAYKTATGSGYDEFIQITVAVRSISGGVVGPIRAQATSAFNQASTVAPSS
jgi:hypothetical protein